jgi:hypothetical protein
MVAARYADEGPAAIPADRMVLDQVPLMTVDDIKITSGDYSIPIGQLYLRPDHRYLLTLTDEQGHSIGSQTISVSAATDPPATAASMAGPGMNCIIATDSTAPANPACH